MKAQKGTGLVIVALAVVLVLVVVLLLSTKKTNAPIVTTQTAGDLNQASSELEAIDVDNSLDSEIIRLDADSSSF